MIPKFRAWLKSVEEMVEVLEIDFYNKEVAYIWTEQVSDYELEQTREVDKIDDLDLIQYTGCRDKNGIEIYEGDVIKDKYDKTWLVQWYVGAFVITDKIPDSDGQTSTYSHFSNVSNHHFYFEVIGNIYENPELLDDIKPYFDELEEQE